MTSASPRALTYTGPYEELFTALPVEQQAELLAVYEILADQPDGLSVTIGNLKGGVSKTTTTVYLALMLGLKGDSVLVVDCDAVNKSSLFWCAATAEWPSNVKVVAWAGEDRQGVHITGRLMAERVLQVRSKFRHVLIDTGPQMDEYLRGALRVTDNFIICSSPYPMDTAQIKPSVTLAAQVEDMKGAPVYCTVLLSRAKKNSNTLKSARGDLEEKEIAYFEQAISALEGYATAPGSVPTDFREYVPVFRQLVEDQVATS